VHRDRGEGSVAEGERERHRPRVDRGLPDELHGHVAAASPDVRIVLALATVIVAVPVELL